MCANDLPLDDGLDRIMVDIETLGIEPGAAVLSIGAVRFGIDGLGETFYRAISLRSCDKEGLSISGNTLIWWLNQEEVTRQVLTGGDPLADVLSDFSSYYGEADEIWANSPSFDCEILNSAYEAVGQDEPWSYSEERCFRTLSTLPVAPEIKEEGVQHHALDDAENQARVIVDALQNLQEHYGG